MTGDAMRKGAVERGEVTGQSAVEQEAINGVVAKDSTDNVAPDNRTSKYVNSGGSSNPPYGGKGHAGA